MFKIIWDKKNNGVILSSSTNGDALNVSPRPVFYEELDLLGFNKYWKYPKTKEPLLWAMDRRYFYKGELVAEVNGGNIFDNPQINITNEGQSLKLNPINLDTLIAENKKPLFLIEHEALQFISETYRIYSLKKIRARAKANEEVDWALLAKEQEKKTKTKYAVIKEDCDSFDIMPFDLASEQNKTIYLNTKIERFVASFSGGKDSQVTLDLVSRALPPDDFVVIYSDTGLEIPPSLDVYEKTQAIYKAMYPGLQFYTSKNQQEVLDYWDKFGAPSRLHRWCCSVMKTAPLYRLLKEINGTGKQPNVLVFEGVRAEESSRREKYARIGKGVKHSTVINARPIFNWNATEIFLYLFMRDLPINDGYRKGLTRVGCSICPYSSEWSEHIVRKTYPDSIEPFVKHIGKQLSETGVRDVDDYIKTGNWKKRAGGKNTNDEHSRIDIIEEKPNLEAILTNPKENIFEWIKTLGKIIIIDESEKITIGEIKTNQTVCEFRIEKNIVGSNLKIAVRFSNSLSDPILFGRIKRVLYKTVYCVHCESCEVECPTGALSVTPQVKINANKCIQCSNCLDFAERGCLMAKSLTISEGGKNMGTKQASIDRYAGFGLRENWLNKYFANIENYFESDNDLGTKQVPAVINWLRDADILNRKDKKASELGLLLKQKYQSDPVLVWEIIWINLMYSSTIANWYGREVPWNSSYTKNEIEAILQSSFPEIKERTLHNALEALANTFKESLLGQKMNIGQIEKIGKDTFVKKQPHENVSHVAVTYSLYRHAIEKNRYDFRVSEFYEDEQKEGIFRQFGLSKERFENILRSLQENKNGILQADLVMGLDNISLREDFTEIEILKLLLDKNK